MTKRSRSVGLILSLALVLGALPAPADAQETSTPGRPCIVHARGAWSSLSTAFASLPPLSNASARQGAPALPVDLYPRPAGLAGGLEVLPDPLVEAPHSITSLGAFHPRSAFEASFTGGEETFAIRQHLETVLAWLRARDVTGLSDTLRERREQQLVRLAHYIERGVFPRNHCVPGLTPVFIDEEGRACAVAYLIQESGARELAEKVALLQNNAYVSEITTAGVARWIEESGLDAAECALIQPSYGCATLGGGFCVWGVAGPMRLDFFATNRQGTGPLTVSFYGYASPLHTIWSWSFGDGATSSLQNPTHTYTSPGRYTVSVTVASVFGAVPFTKTKVDYVVVVP